MVSDKVEKVPKTSSCDSKSAGFLFFVTCVAVAAGFGTTVARARKSMPSHLSNHYDEGARLATKALGYGTLISVTSCGLLVFGVMKAFGVNTAKEFGLKMKEILPQKDGEFAKKFDNWPTKFPEKPDDGKWKEYFK